MEVTYTKKPFHVIAGAFRYPENATRQVITLKEQGYNARILGVNKWGLTQVAFDSFENRSSAYKQLLEVRKSVDETAWLLIQDL